MAAIRDFHIEVWATAGPDELGHARQVARESLGDLAATLDEHTTAQLVEEYARDLFRERYDWLTAATVWDLLGPSGELP